MLANLLLFAVIAAFSLQPGESKNLVKVLGSALTGNARILKVDCRGPCQKVEASLVVSSGSPYLYAAQDVPPFLSGSSCSNCFCREWSYSLKTSCQKFSLNKGSFVFLSVLAYSHYIGAKVYVSGPNVIGVNSYHLPSKVIDLGSSKEGGKRYFKATCHGLCEEVKAYVEALSGNPNLFVAKRSLPILRDTNVCNNCLCKSTSYGLTDGCQFFILGDSSSFFVSVAAHTYYEKAILKVQAFNLKDVKEIIVPSKVLDLGSAKKGSKRYFNATCNGQCEEVNVYVWAKSGNPNLFVAKHFLPTLRGTSRCKDCFCTSTSYGLTDSCKYFSLGDSNSFAIAVAAHSYYEKASLKVKAFNFNNFTEITIPSQVIFLGSALEGNTRYFKATCHGACLEMFVEVKTSLGYSSLYLAKYTIPQIRSSTKCRNCFHRSYGYSLTQDCPIFSFGDANSFYFAVKAYRDYVNANVKLEAFNYGGVTEIFFPSMVIKLGSAVRGQKMHFLVTCKGPCSEIDVEVWTLSGIPRLFLALKSQPAPTSYGRCNKCFCASTSYRQRQSCSTFHLEDSHSFFVTIQAYRGFVDGRIKFRGQNLLDCTDKSTGKKYNAIVYDGTI